MSTQLLIVILLVINIPLYIRLNRLFFKDSAEFKEAITSNFVLRIFPIFHREHWEGAAGRLKANTFFALCGFIVFLEYVIIDQIMEWIAG